MSDRYYAVFGADRAEPQYGLRQPAGIKVIWWEPSWTRIFPPHHSGLRIFMYWLFSRLRIFRNRHYAVLVIEDQQFRLMHRTFVIPAWVQFPFMARDDVQLGDVFTVPEARRQGLALFGLRYCLDRLKGGARVFYIAQPINSPSHRLALSAGLKLLSLAKKWPSKEVGYYTLIPKSGDLELLSAAADARISTAQFECLLGADLHSTTHFARHPGKVRVVAVIPTSGEASTMIFAHRQMAAIASRGHDVEIFKLGDRRNPLELARALLRYRQFLRSMKPDLVHVHYGAMTAFFGVYGAIGLAPVVVTFRGSDLNPVPSLPWWRSLASHFLSHVAALGAAHVICVSSELRARLLLGRRKAAVIPTGVDTGRFRPLPRDEARRALGWSPSTPTVLFNAGRSPKVKRLDLAQGAIDAARRSIVDLNFVVMDGHVPPDDVPTLMQASDCLILTSDFEGSPTVVQEAMASNLPVVSVPVGDVAEQLREIEPSYLVPRDPDRIADAVVHVVRAARRSNGYEKVIAELGNDAIARSVERVYAYVRDGQ